MAGTNPFVRVLQTEFEGIGKCRACKHLAKRMTCTANRRKGKGAPAPRKSQARTVSFESPPSRIRAVLICHSSRMQAMPQYTSPEVVVQRQLDAYNAKNLDAWLATYAPDARQFEPRG